MSRPKLLDLFCGGGGASVGYHRAGFDVVGVDVEPQPHYPFDFFREDAIRVLDHLVRHWAGKPSASAFSCDFDAVHVSPPCQDHIRGGLQGDHGTGWLLAACRDRLSQLGVPWVIENVPGAPMRADYLLCGSHFGLPVRRHRWFETSWHGFGLIACDHSRRVCGVYGHPHGQEGAWPGMLPGTVAGWSAAMGIDWMSAGELTQAIPPAYTEFIGAQLLEHLTAAEGAA